jgi:hypothetical protein
MLVNTTQVYPEDRGTNYAVRDGARCAREMAALSPGETLKPVASAERPRL